MAPARRSAPGNQYAARASAGHNPRMDRTPQRHAESLLNALDPLPFPQRMRELALRVGELVPLRPVLEELESRGPYEREIGRAHV